MRIDSRVREKIFQDYMNLSDRVAMLGGIVQNDMDITGEELREHMEMTLQLMRDIKTTGNEVLINYR